MLCYSYKLCISDAKLSGVLLRPTVGSSEIHVALTTSITSYTREILTGSTKYQGIDGYFCDNVVYPVHWYTRTTTLSRPEDGHFC